MLEHDDVPQSKDFSAFIRFSDLSKRLDKIQKAKSPTEKSDKLKRFIDSFGKSREAFMSDNGPDATASFSPILRLIRPKEDMERSSLGVQRKRLGEAFVKALAINKHSPDARKLTGADDATKNLNLGDVVFAVMTDRHTQDGTMTIYEVNKCLDQMASKATEVDSILARAILHMTPLDCKWFTRIILKKLNLGLGFIRIMQLYHPKAVDCYNQYSLLSRTCEIVESGRADDISDDNHTHIELFQPIRPMLCERGKIAEINKLLAEDNYFIETKMDGERILIHINGNEYKYFSRSCIDESTNIFGADSSGGLFSPLLHRLLNGKFESAILDGEMMVWNRSEKDFVSKTDKATARFLTANDPPQLNPCFCIYDLMYLNGKALVNMPYAERIRKVRSLVTEVPGQLMFCKREKIRDAEHFLECVNKAFDDREEGVVIKGSESIYQPGKRDGGGWYKIKPDYEKNLVEDFDLLVIGGYYNDRRTAVYKLLLGVYCADADNNNKGGKFYAVTSVRHSFSVDERRCLQKKLEPYWQSVRGNSSGRSNRYLDFMEWNRADPDFWIEPKNSVVLQIRASDLYASGTYRTSHTFRFPRVVAIRDDKPWTDCCTLNEFKKFCSAKPSLTKRHVTMADVGEASTSRPLRKRQKLNTANGPSNASGVLTTDAKDAVVLIDDVCAGRDFCILNSGKHDIDELKAIVRKHGGRVVENPGRDTFVCIAGNKTSIRVTHAQRRNCNIATADWLIKKLGSNAALTSMPKFQRQEMIHATDELLNEFAANCDTYGDSYSDPFTKEDFCDFLAKMNVASLPNYTKHELYEMEMEIWAPDQSPNLFRSMTALFMSTPNKRNFDIELAEFKFTTKAGHVLKVCNNNENPLKKLTHIFVDENDFDSSQLLRMKGVGTQTKIISFKWIFDCCDANKRLCDALYTLHA